MEVWASQTMASQVVWHLKEEDGLENGREGISQSRQEEWPEQSLGIGQFQAGLGRKEKSIPKVLSLWKLYQHQLAQDMDLVQFVSPNTLKSIESASSARRELIYTRRSSSPYSFFWTNFSLSSIVNLIIEKFTTAREIHSNYCDWLI